ncbi:MAG: BrnT family toxin [Rhodocyclaceae bacterium]|nr:BrnT family toxin [Rhodocyclaceae bacterium]
MSLRFEWDPTKAVANVRKHGVSFDLAALVFADPFALTAQDRIEDGERRWQTLGLVEGCLLLLVAHTVIDADKGSETIRIISARKATRKERQRYDHENR